MIKLLNKTYKDYKKFKINELFGKKCKKIIVTSNPETYMYAIKNKNLYNLLLDENTLIIPDSIGAEYAIKKKLNKKVKRLPGVELLTKLLSECNKREKKIYVYGSKKEVNDKFCEFIKSKYKKINIVGNKDGYNYSAEEISKEIIKKKPDLTIVALGIPKQELFVGELSEKINNGIMIGVGGSLDVLSGTVKRAPKFFIKLKLEWLYRILKEPKRIKRFYNSNIKFIFELNRC